MPHKGNKYEVSVSSPRAGALPTRHSLYQQTKALLTEEALTKFIQRQSETPIGYIGLSSLPFGGSHRRHLGRGLSDHRQESLRGLLRSISRHFEGNEGGRRHSAIWNGKPKISEDLPGRWASEPSSEVNTGYTMCVSSVCRVTRHPAPCGIGRLSGSCQTGTSKLKSRKKGSSSNNSKKNPARFLPAESPALTPAVNIDLDQPMEERIERTEQISGENPFEPIRDPDRCPGHRPCPRSNK